MKKRLLTLCLFSLALCLIFCMPTFAARREKLPVTIVDAYSSVTINSLTVSSVENLPGQYMNRIHYATEVSGVSGYTSLVMHCFNSKGAPLGTYSFSEYGAYIDVPDTTAAFEIAARYPTPRTDSYYYYKYINVYSYDGRSMLICNLELPIYRMVGWYEGVLMYALDGRTKEVSPFLVDAYSQVGWYTAEDLYYREVQQKYHTLIAAYDYNGLIELADTAMARLAGTRHEASLMAIRYDAITRWRKALNAPLGVVEAGVEHYYALPQLYVTFRNVSTKTVASVKLTLTCYDAYGNVQKTNYDYYYLSNAQLSPGQLGTYGCSLQKAKNASTVSNIRLIEVTFTDGTKWRR